MYVIYVSGPLEKPLNSADRERKANAAIHSTANPALLSVLENAPISLL